MEVLLAYQVGRGKPGGDVAELEMHIAFDVAGALFVQGDIGWLDWGATAPAFRRRGGQSAVRRQRMLMARELGCRLIATETGEAVAGAPRHSYGNITRMGFRTAYLRENYAPPRPD